MRVLLFIIVGLIIFTQSPYYKKKAPQYYKKAEDFVERLLESDQNPAKKAYYNSDSRITSYSTSSSSSSPSSVQQITTSPQDSSTSYDPTHIFGMNYKGSYSSPSSASGSSHY